MNIRVVSVIITTACVFQIAFAADVPVVPEALEKEPFHSLQVSRDELLKQISINDDSLALLKSQLGWREYESQKETELLAAKQNKESASEIKRLESELENARNSAGEPKALKELQDEAEKVRATGADLLKSKKAIDYEMNSRADVEHPKQAFRLNMSIAFTVLVGLVIVGFYALAWIDEKLRQEMFSRQSGIQFITLFSLVIAIILFGITGILESRELSALLGGLSGYILGRSTDKSSINTPSPTPS